MSKCQKDSGSMFGCVPVCDREATVRVTVSGGCYGPLTYLSCDRHRRTFGVWPDVSTVEPLTAERHTCARRADGFYPDEDVYCPACLAVAVTA